MKYFFFLFSIVFVNSAFAEIDKQLAEELVKSANCTGKQSIAEILDHRIKKRSSQRDLGWRVFENDSQYDVERSLLVSKSIHIRYRWQVNNEGNIHPVSPKAKKLCSEIFSSTTPGLQQNNS